eukprot:scaffold327871_cov42-Prasinocladus_malaysianus.AAC.1
MLSFFIAPAAADQKENIEKMSRQQDRANAAASGGRWGDLAYRDRHERSRLGQDDPGGRG